MSYRRLVPCLTAAACLVLCGCTGKSSQPIEKSGAAKGGRPDGVPVNIAKATTRDVPLDLQIIGNVEAYSTITVKALVGGQLTQVNFREGDFVNKGELLFTVDQRPLEASLRQAEANIARDEAALAQAKANLARDTATLKNANSQADRYARLFKEGIVSREQSESIRTNADALEQAVAADNAAIQSAKANIGATAAAIETVKVQLSYTKITSPITGRTGNLATKLGNVVNANTMDLLTINEVQPIYVTFAVPEAELPRIKKYMAVSKLKVIAAPQDDPSHTDTGTLTFIDNSVDPNTGTIKLKGTFPNANRSLWPGQFVRVTLRLATQKDVVVIPNQAVQNGQEGNYVFVVKADRSVESRPVKTGSRSGEDLLIDTGLEAGETVVTEGQLRLAPGMKIVLRENRPAGGKKGGGPKSDTGTR